MTATTTHSTEATDDDAVRRRWAALQLGTPHGAAREQVAAAFARGLREAEFQPSRELQEAFWMLAAGDPAPRPLTIAPQAERHDLLSGEVEDFALHFFEFEPQRRRGRWQELAQRAGSDPRLSVRLARLDVCLDVPVPAMAEVPPAAAALWADLARLFVLPPADGAALREAILARASGDPTEIGQAAHWLRKHGAAAAAPALLDELATWSGRPTRVKALVKRTAALHQEVQKASPVAKKSQALAGLLVVLCSVIGFIVKESVHHHDPPPAVRMPPSLDQQLQELGGAGDLNPHLREMHRAMQEARQRSMVRVRELPSATPLGSPGELARQKHFEDQMREFHERIRFPDRPHDIGISKEIDDRLREVRSRMHPTVLLGGPHESLRGERAGDDREDSAP